MAKSLKNLESLIEKGENPNGYTGQTANGTTHWRGTGWNKQQPMPDKPQVEAGGAWQGKLSTRSGE